MNECGILHNAALVCCKQQQQQQLSPKPLNCHVIMLVVLAAPRRKPAVLPLIVPNPMNPRSLGAPPWRLKLPLKVSRQQQQQFHQSSLSVPMCLDLLVSYLLYAFSPAASGQFSVLVLICTVP